MQRLFNWLILFPFGLAIVVFSVSNRAAVTLDLWPMPYQVTLPFYLIFVATLIFGFVLGGIVTSVAGARARTRARAAKAEKEKAARANAALGTNTPSDRALAITKEQRHAP